MIRPGFLDSDSRRDLIELARDGSAAHRLARRANALVLLDKGMSCQSIAEVLLLDGDTIRIWYRLYQEDGIEGLASFGHEGGTCRLTVEQQGPEGVPRQSRWECATIRMGISLRGCRRREGVARPKATAPQQLA
ncbi:MAG TPA: helix-turn-helix domain-containing protein [Bradyrhizobium sp.]